MKYKQNGEYYFCFDEVNGIRSWADAVRYGFVSAGGKPRFTDPMKKPQISDRVWVFMPIAGYIGVGTVSGLAKPARETVISINDEQI